jgi:hypothetical protein
MAYGALLEIFSIQEDHKEIPNIENWLIHPVSSDQYPVSVCRNPIHIIERIKGGNKRTNPAFDRV